MRIKRRKYRTLAFAYKTAGLLWGLVHVCAVVGFLTDWTQPLLYAGIGLFSLLTVNACIGGCWRAEARADRLTRQIAEKDKPFCREEMDAHHRRHRHRHHHRRSNRPI